MARRRGVNRVTLVRWRIRRIEILRRSLLYRGQSGRLRRRIIWWAITILAWRWIPVWIWQRSWIPRVSISQIRTSPWRKTKDWPPILQLIMESRHRSHRNNLPLLIYNINLYIYSSFLCSLNAVMHIARYCVKSVMIKGIINFIIS